METCEEKGRRDFFSKQYGTALEIDGRDSEARGRMGQRNDIRHSRFH